MEQVYRRFTEGVWDALDDSVLGSLGLAEGELSVLAERVLLACIKEFGCPSPSGFDVCKTPCSL